MVPHQGYYGGAFLFQPCLPGAFMIFDGVEWV